MKLLYIVPSCNTEGGVARVLSLKTNYLIEKWEYEVDILTQNSGNSSSFYNFNDRITFHDMALKGNWVQFFNSYRKELNQHVKIIKPDVIVVCDNGLKAFTIPYILSTNIPIVFECHGSKYIQEHKTKSDFFSKEIQFLKYKFKDFGAKKFSRFVALSKESLQEWNIETHEIIPNPSWVKPTDDNLLENKKVIAVARNSYEKGLDRLLKIWQRIIKKHPDWVLEIYGEAVEELKSSASKLGINSSVKLSKPVANIKEKYKVASVFVMTSRHEGFPMVLIEAMASGLPCVAYDCPVGPRALINQGENGFLVQDENETLFVERLVALIEDSVLREKIGAMAQQSVLKYDLDVIMLQWKNLFENLKRQ